MQAQSQMRTRSGLILRIGISRRTYRVDLTQPFIRFPATFRLFGGLFAVPSGEGTRHCI